eukprot:362129-Chlamydomonas_euryale.AAC.4
MSLISIPAYHCYWHTFLGSSAMPMRTSPTYDSPTICLRRVCDNTGQKRVDEHLKMGNTMHPRPHTHVAEVRLGLYLHRANANAGTINSKQSHLSCEAGRQLQKGSCQSGAQVDNLRIHQSPSHGAQCASVQYLDRLLQPTRNVQVAPAHEVIPQFLRLYHTVLEQRSIKLDKRVEVHTAANVLSDADDEVGPAAGGLCNPRVVRCVVAHVLHATWTWRVVRQQPLSMQHCTRPRRKPAVCMALLCITD